MALHDIAIDRSNTVDRVVEALQEAIFSGELPPGAPLSEVALATTFHVGRSTIREALKLLTADGMVTRLSNRRLVVRLLTSSDIDDAFQARQVLEVAGIRAAPRASRSAMQALIDSVAAYEAAVAADDVQLRSKAHSHIHLCIIGLAGSERLTQFARSLLSDLRLAVATVDRASDDAPVQVKDHQKLLRLIRSADTEKALQELDRHLAHAKAYVPVQSDLPAR